MISATGIRPDDKKYDAIKNFPRPTDIKSLRAFCGLAVQLGSFIPDLSHLLARMRKLLTKDTAWVWLPEHEQDFIKTKETLTNKTTVHPFDPDIPTILLTDASRLYGIGYLSLIHI